MFTRKGTLTLTPGLGWRGGGPFGTSNITPNPPKIEKKKNTYVCSYLFSPEGNFDIDAGDGGGHIPQIPKISSTKTRKGGKLNIYLKIYYTLLYFIYFFIYVISLFLLLYILYILCIYIYIYAKHIISDLGTEF